MKLRFSQKGLSLVELMVSVTIGLFLLAGISLAYLSSRQAFRTQDAGGRNQEALRQAFEILGTSTRMAGYVGCTNLRSIVPNIIANPPVPNFIFGQAVRAFDNGTDWVNPTTRSRVGGTDVITIMRGSLGSLHLTGNMGTVNANIQVNGNPYGFQANQVLIVTDCSAADIFRATNVSSGSGTVTIAHSNSANTTNNLSKTYQQDAQVMALEQETFFIAANDSGNPALYRIRRDTVTNTDVAEELIEHVYDMQITLGVDSNGSDGSADQYLSPATVTDWTQVVSVRYDLAVRSPEDSNAVSARTYTYSGTNVTDRRLWNRMNLVVGLRNLLP